MNKAGQTSGLIWLLSPLIGTPVIAATNGWCAGCVAHVAIFQSKQMTVAHHAAGDVVVGETHGDAVFIDHLDGEDVDRKSVV